MGIMPRVCFLQQRFALPDPAAKVGLYESAVLRRFIGVDLSRAPAPSETTILNFRHLLEKQQLCGQILDAANHYLESRGIRIAAGARKAQRPRPTKSSTARTD
jgi:IS5 family transposase